MTDISWRRIDWRNCEWRQLSQNLMRNVTVHVSQPKVAAAIEVREPRVVDSQQMQDRGVQIVDVHPVFDRIVANLVRAAISDATLHTAACHPHAVPIRVMVTTVSLGDGRPTKLRSPQN